MDYKGRWPEDCAKFRNNLTKDEGVMVKRANVLPNGLDRRTDYLIN